MAISKILLSDNVTELTGVKSVVYKETVNADVCIRSGCVASASIEVEVYGTQATAVSAGDTVYYYQLDKNNTATLIGIFTCEPVIQTKTSYKFVAYDNAQKLNADFSQWLRANQSNFPMTINALVNAACTVAGVTLGSSSWGLHDRNVNAFYSDGVTCRDILSYAAEIACAFIRCHSDGSIYFNWFTSNANTIAPSVGTGQYAYKQDGLNYANYTTAALNRVAVHPSGEDDVAYIYPSAVTSGNTIHIQNNLLLTGADSGFYNTVASRQYNIMTALGTYRPMTANLFVKENPFRAGDIVSVTDSQGVTFTSIITGMTVSESGAVLESTGYETYDEGTGNTQKAITQLASDVVRINKLKVDWADINTAIINYLTANNVTAQNLTIVDEYGNVIATFDANGIVLGNPSTTHAELDYNSFELYDRSGNKYLDVGDARTDNNPITVTETFISQPSQTNFVLGYNISNFSQFLATVNGSAPSGYFTQGLMPNMVVYNTAGYGNLKVGDVVEFTYPTLDPIYHYVLGTRAGTLGAFATSNGKNATASGSFSAIGGGYGNKASGGRSVVSGGESNTASGTDSAIGGGQNNVASGLWSAVAGGCENEATTSQSFVGGGYGNEITNGLSSVIGGGLYNNISSAWECASILGGKNNTASEGYAAICGGVSNTASGQGAFVGGGGNNTSSGLNTVVGGGSGNTASANESAILGGAGNSTTGYCATVVGGEYNIANHRDQTVFGEYNIADPSTATWGQRGNYIEIVGNGTANNARSNARTLDWSGNEVVSGSVTSENGSPAFYGKATSKTSSATVPSTTNSVGFRMTDKDGKAVAIFTDRYQSNGENGAMIMGGKEVSGSSIYNYMMLLVNSSGNKTVTLSDPDAWRKALELCYVANDTMAITSSLVLHGLVNSNTTVAYFDVVVEKSMENISSISVTTMTGYMVGVSGAVDGSASNKNYTGSGYSISCTKQGTHHVRVGITKSGGYTNVNGLTPVTYFGTLTLKFT